MGKRHMDTVHIQAALLKRSYVHLIIGCLIVCPLSYKYWRCLSQSEATIPSGSVTMNPMILPPKTNTSKVVIKTGTMNLTPSLAEVADSESLLTTSSHALPHRTVTDGAATQKTDSVTELIISNQVATDHDKLAIHTKYASAQISISKNLSLLTETRKPTIPQRLSKENEKFRSKKHHKVTHQHPISASPSAAQKLIQTVARMYTSRSTTPEILERFQHQYHKRSQFCNYYNYSSELPQDTVTQNDLFHHLLYDDSKRIIFCYVPKAGCSNWKRMFAVLNGTEQASNRNRSKPHILKNVNKLEHLSKEERDKRLKTYFKFAFVRNPFERIVSAYRNKIAVPIHYTNREHWPDDILYHILRTYNQEKYNKWAQTNFSSIFYFPSFQNFAQYLVDVNLDLLNEHFRPFLNLCHPCAVNYNFIGNFYHLPQDAYYILDFLRIPHDYYLNRPGHTTYNTSSLVLKYYNELPGSLKLKLMHKFSHELIMYYQLFPTEHRRDIEILRLT